MLRARVALEKGLSSSVDEWLKDTIRRAARAIRAGKGLENVIEAGRSRFQTAHRSALIRAENVGLLFERDWIERQRPTEKTEQREGPTILVDLSASAANFLEGWLKARNVGVWQRVSGSLNAQLSKTLIESIKRGDNMNDRARAVEQLLGKTPYQARRIARTETVAGMNAGQQAQRVNAEIEFKEWVSTIDDRTRNATFDHVSCDGQTVGNLLAFTVSAQRLMFPGDVSLGASAGNVVHCRCSSVAAFPDAGKTVVTVPQPVVKLERVRKGGEDEGAPAVEKPAATAPAEARAPWREDGSKPRTAKRQIVKGHSLESAAMEYDHEITRERIKTVEDRLRFRHDKLEEIRGKVLAFRDKWAEIENEIAKVEAAKIELEKLRRERDEASRGGKALSAEAAARRMELARYIDSNGNVEAMRAKLRPQILKVLSLPVDKRARVQTVQHGKTRFAAADEAARFVGSVLSRAHEANPMHNQGGNVFKIGVIPGASRPHYSMGRMHGSRNSKVGDWVHEIGHAIEQFGEVHELAKGYLHKRIGGERPQYLYKLFKGYRFRKTELGRGDKWDWFLLMTNNPASKFYVGKFYAGDTEIIAMGLEALFLDPVGFAISDPEFFRFIVGILSGLIL